MPPEMEEYMTNRNLSRSPRTRTGFRISAATAIAALALWFGTPSDAAVTGMERARISVGAGSMAYIAQESPSTGLSLDTRVEYQALRNISVEGSATTAFSESVEDNSTTIPLLLDAGVKIRAPASGNIDLYGAAALGYGAYLSSDEVEDGTTFGLPLSVGAEWRLERLNFAPRFTYRPVFGDELGDVNADADSWIAVLDFQLPFL
jgi:hypothetical protein